MWAEIITNPAVLAVVATVFGGVGLKVVEHWLNKAKRAADDAAGMRTELRGDLTRTRTELDKVEHELDEWKTKYYNLMSEFIKIRAELDACLNALKKSNERLQDFGKGE